MNVTELNLQSNNLLGKLLPMSTSFWKNAIRDIDPNNPDACEKLISSVLKYVDKHEPVDIMCGIRFVAGSEPHLSKACMPGLLPSQASLVFSTLKNQNRVMQVGRGRGKGFAIFSHKEVIVEASSLIVDASDPIALAEALKNSLVSNNNDMKVLQNLVLEQSKVLKKQQESISKLEEQLTTSFQKTWY